MKKYIVIIVSGLCLLFLMQGPFRQIEEPVMSVKSGCYDEPFELTMECEEGVDIYYTLDGSDPDENSLHYESPIFITDRTSEPNVWSARTDLTIESEYGIPEYNVEKATIVKAVAYGKNGKSEVVTSSYFVGWKEWENHYDASIPILSIVGDSEVLFDADDGMLVLGKAFEEWLKDNEGKEPKGDLEIKANFNIREERLPVTVSYYKGGIEQFT